jgi:hypothetical protein
LGFEDIEIRITKKGEVFFKVEGSTERRLRDYHSFLEEMIGPIQSETPIQRPEWEKPSELSEQTEEEKRRQQQIER